MAGIIGIRVSSLLAVVLIGLSPAGVPEATADGAGNTVEVVMATAEGDIALELYPASAPKTVANFLAYVDGGYYDGGSIYRVVRHDNDNGSPKIQVIQGGANIPDDEMPLPPVPHEPTSISGLRHMNGTISMARLEPGSATHAFFIVIGEQPGLDAGGTRNPDGQGFAAFGYVISGMEVVRRINAMEATAPVDDAYVKGQILADPVIIISVSRK